VARAAPYLSVVATARNDDHGGDLLYRLDVFVRSLAAQCDRHGIDAELVLVEWNPPTERARLAEAVDWPQSERCRMRIVEVPTDLHAKLQYGDRLPLFQMMGKNVGVRRARGAFVLATNIDIIFPDEIMQFIAARELRNGVVYRVDRYDVTADIPVNASIDEQLRLCSERVIRIHERDSTRDLRTGASYRIFWPPWWVTVALKGLLDHTGGRLAKPNADGTRARRPRIAFVRDALAWERARLRLHTNASGDFTLIDAEGWARVMGYPEIEAYSMHLDGLLLYQAHHAGLREQDLAHRIYHLEHASGFKPDDEGLAALNDRLARESIPQIGYPQFKNWAIEMYTRRGPLTFNDENWGFAREHLPEIEPTVH
jgi:hypothetical protein